MPEHVVALVADGLNDDRKSLNGARVLILGVAYKKDVNDVRESPALSIIDRLRAKGADVCYHDPFVAHLSSADTPAEDCTDAPRPVNLTDEELTAADCVIVVTDHTNVDYTRVARLARIVVDTRDVMRPHRAKSRARILTL